MRSAIGFTTKNDKFPVGRITVLKGGESDSTIVITESGTPDAYVIWHCSITISYKYSVNSSILYLNATLDAQDQILCNISAAGAEISGL